MAKVIQTRLPAVSFGVRIQQLSLLSTHEMHRLDCVAASPLLGFIQELSEDRPSEVVGQSAGHVVSDEAFDDGLSEGEFLTLLNILISLIYSKSASA